MGSPDTRIHTSLVLSGWLRPFLSQCDPAIECYHTPFPRDNVPGSVHIVLQRNSVHSRGSLAQDQERIQVYLEQAKGPKKLLADYRIILPSADCYITLHHRDMHFLIENDLGFGTQGIDSWEKMIAKMRRGPDLEFMGHR